MINMFMISAVLIHMASSVQLQCYVLETSVQHSFKLIFISVEPVIEHCCKNC